MFRMWNIVLIAIAFTLAEMGMFINRGGPVPSVHSFAQSTMGWLFLAFMGLTLLGSLAAFAWRMNTLRSQESLDSMLSRESAFLTQNVLFLAVAFITLWGTIYPVITQASQDVTITVGEPFFNRVNGPILLVIVILMGIGPLLPWRRATWSLVFKTVRVPLISALLTTIVLVVSGIHRPIAVIAIAIVTITIIGIIHEWIRGTRSRHRKGESLPTAFIRLLSGNRPRYGGYIVHLGISVLAIGAIGSSFYEIQRDFAMTPGETQSLGNYTFNYLSFDKTSFSDRDEVKARFSVRKDEREIGTMYAQRSFYHDFKMASTRAAIRSNPIEDFYIVPSEFQEDGRTVFRIYINPLVWWMWAAGPIFVLGTLFAISPKREPDAITLTIPTSPRQPRV